jgi:PTH1 family peptidyl-tRNA hydrolase
MNLSGESIKALMDFYKISLSDLMVIYDDFDLKKGDIRIREKGSSGTHNGMRNIISMLGSENFARIRIGFNPGVENKIPLIDLVLSGIKKEDKEIFDRAIEQAGKASYDFALGVKIQDIMQKYNGKNKN